MTELAPQIFQVRVNFPCRRAVPVLCCGCAYPLSPYTLYLYLPFFPSPPHSLTPSLPRLLRLSETWLSFWLCCLPVFMSLSLSPTVLDGLSALTRLSKPDASAALAAAVSCCTAPASPPSLPDAPDAKAAVSALATVLLEASKLTASPDEVRTALGEAGVEGAVSAGVCAALEAEARNIRAAGASPPLLPQLVDLDVTLKYVVRSEKEEKVNSPEYVVRVTTAACESRGAALCLVGCRVCLCWCLTAHLL